MKNRFCLLTILVTLFVVLAARSARAATTVVTYPRLTSVGVVTGGDMGEGLDLDGNFVYALSIGGDPQVAVQVRYAHFLPLTDKEVPGATLVAKEPVLNWYTVDYGTTQNDANLAVATSSISYSEWIDPNMPAVILTLDNLEKGAEYKIQIMVGEQCCTRAFDVFVD